MTTPAHEYARGFHDGQRDMRERAANCCAFDVYNIGNVTRDRIQGLKITTCHVAETAPVPLPVPGNSAEAPEPPGGFMAVGPARLWKVMWAAGYELPPAERFVDPSRPNSWNITKVLGGPFVGRNVCVVERAGEWAACELGKSDERDTDWYAAVRLCHLALFRAPSPAPRSSAPLPEIHPCA